MAARRGDSKKAHPAMHTEQSVVFSSTLLAVVADDKTIVAVMAAAAGTGCHFSTPTRCSELLLLGRRVFVSLLKLLPFSILPSLRFVLSFTIKHRRLRLNSGE